MENETRIHAYSDDALGGLDACGVAARIASGDVSAREVVHAAIDRARAVDPTLNALAATDFEAALRRADLEPGGRLSGVPTVIKDNTALAGLPTQYGSEAFVARPETRSSGFVEHLLDAGLIALGKSRLPEFAFNVTCEYGEAPPVRNPWGTEYSTGGSSGGAAAMVAAGVVPIAHATDAGGSIRIPAAACGLVGLKPSRGRIAPDPGDRMMPLRIAVQGVLSRSVRDSAAVLAEAERRHRAPRLRPVRDVRCPGTTRLRIGVLGESPTEHPLDRETIAAVRRTADVLSDLGHDVVEMSYAVPADYLRDYLAYLGMLMAMIRARATDIVGGDLDRSRMDRSTTGIADLYLRRRSSTPAILTRLLRIRRQYLAMFGDADVLLSPTVAHTTPKLGHLSPAQDYTTWERRLAAFDSIAPLSNISGAPAVSLPLHRTESGMPLGLQFAAPLGEERKLLELAFELEEATPWPLLGPDAMSAQA